MLGYTKPRRSETSMASPAAGAVAPATEAESVDGEAWGNAAVAERVPRLEVGPELAPPDSASDIEPWWASEMGALGVAVVDYFENEKGRCMAEVYAAYEGGQEEGPFWCSDGTVVRCDLYDAICARR